jgi:hypothetical protein
MGGGAWRFHRVDSATASQGLVQKNKKKQNHSWEVKNKNVSGRRRDSVPARRRRGVR